MIGAQEKTTVNTVIHNRHAFDSFDAFIEDVKQVPAKNSSRDLGRDEFFGTANFEAAVALASTGWQEGAEKVGKIRGELDWLVEASKVAATQQFAWDVTGDFVDVGRVLSGEPESCGSYANDDVARSGSQRVVRLYCNLGVSASVTHDAIFARGACVLAAVDVLETLGVRVELWAAKATEKRANASKIHQVEVLVKSAGQAVDVDRLAFILCHPSCLRRLFWSHQERYGYLPNHCYPHAIAVDEGCVATSECHREASHTNAELAAEVARICSECGVTIPDFVS
jgi:hypothetical protein